MTRPPISRGFRGRRPDGHTDRLPPGQYVTSDFPVLSAGPTPHTDLESWSFSIYDGDTVLAEWSYVDHGLKWLGQLPVPLGDLRPDGISELILRVGADRNLAVLACQQ